MIKSLLAFLGLGNQRSNLNLQNLTFKEEFLIGDIDFQLEKSKCNFEYVNNKIIDLTITGNIDKFQELEEQEQFEFKGFIDPPQLMIRNTLIVKNEVTQINQHSHYDSELSLCFGEHGHFDIELQITEDWINIKGNGEIYGNNYPIQINYRTKE